MPTFTVERIDTSKVKEYAYTRSLNANGNVVMQGPTWKAGQPMGETVLRTITTQLGTCEPAPDFGLDYSVFDHYAPNSAKKIEAAIFKSLRYLTSANLIQRLKVEVQLKRLVSGYEVLADISFYDPRSRNNIRVKGKF
jgi:hypothetical protein